jgi:arylsulfatase A-like enzyme
MKVVTRSRHVAIAAAILQSVCVISSSNAAEPTPAGAARIAHPNIIFILADDLGYGDLGCYGQKQIQTPSIDRLAADGMRFTQCYAGCTVCAPSRCCLMTGMHTGHAWVRGNQRIPLRPEDVTVAQVLKSAGYATALVGKWGLGEPDTTGIPNRKGFDEFFGYLNQRHAHNSWPEYLWKNEQKYPLAGNVEKKGISSQCVQFSNDLFTREALSFIDRHSKGPFFLYLAYTVPHANDERGAAESNGIEVPSDAPYSDRPWPATEKNFAAMITRMDGDIAHIMKRLRELGIDDNTIVFFSSDNGPHKEGGQDPTFFKSGGPLRGIKRDMYEGGIRVPMIVRWPGHVKSGAVSDQVWGFWDFLPTAAELAGAKAPPKIDGLSMAPTLIGEKAVGHSQQDHKFLYWEFHEGGFKQAVRMGNWKAVRLAPDKPLQLYNLKDDIGETHNVAAEHPDVVAKIEAYLKGARTESPHWAGPRPAKQ